MLAYYVNHMGRRIPVRVINLLEYGEGLGYELEVRITGLTYAMFGFKHKSVHIVNPNMVHVRSNVKMRKGRCVVNGEPYGFWRTMFETKEKTNEKS